MRKNIAFVSALFTVLFACTTAFAQSAPNTVAITSNPTMGTVAPGAGVSLGTVTLSSPGGSYTVNSVPVNLAVGGGALAGNLTNCALFNTTGASTTTALGPNPSIVSGSNSFALSPAITVNSGSPVTLAIHCDVNTAAPLGSTFLFTTSATSTSVGTQTTGPSLAAEADFVKQVPAGLNNAIIGIITLDATKSNQAVTLTSVPISVTASNGATLNALTNCVVTTSNGTILTTGGNAVGAITGANTFMLDKPLSVPAGEGALLVLRCNVSSTAPVGGMLTVGFSPSSFSATSGGNPVTVTQGTTASGTQGTNSGVITVGAQGSSPIGVGTSGSVGTPATPGTPNTGAGGEAPMTYMILAFSLVVALFAGREMLRTR